jgi:hypothetical protein
MKVTDALLPFVPGANEIKNIYEATTGYNVTSGKPLTAFERGVAVFGVLTLGAGSAVVEGTETFANMAREVQQEEQVEQALSETVSQQTLNQSASAGPTTVIGRRTDLLAPGALGTNEQTLLDRLTPDLGDPQLNWRRNAGVLRQEMRGGLPIRDASPAIDMGGPFLNAERYLLRDRGWTYDPATNFWMPPN